MAANVNKREELSSKMNRLKIMTYEVSRELLELTDDEYDPPKLHFKRAQFDRNVEFGSPEMRDQFCIDFENWTFLNHGAFGGALRLSLDAVHDLQLYAESQPLRFVDRNLIPMMIFVLRRLARFLTCDPRDIVLVSNATEAIATVVKSIGLQNHDKVYFLNTRYYAVNKLLMQIKQEKDIEIQEITLPFPSSEEDILDLVDKTLQPGTKLAIFDHIPSVHPIIMPVDKLIKLCHEKQVEVLIDGAHALGAVPLNLSQLNADFYVTNCHKWLCNAKGCAALYVDKKHQSRIHSLTPSGGFGRGFNEEFIYRGLRDYSPYLALHVALDFWLTYGPCNIQSYITNLAHKAAKMLASKWSTDTLFPISMYGPMVLVRLPDVIWSFHGNTIATRPVTDHIQDLLHYDHGIEVPIKPINGRAYVRISAHVYNRFEDYELLERVVSKMVESSTSQVNAYRQTRF